MARGNLANLPAGARWQSQTRRDAAVTMRENGRRKAPIRWVFLPSALLSSVPQGNGRQMEGDAKMEARHNNSS